MTESSVRGIAVGQSAKELQLHSKQSETLHAEHGVVGVKERKMMSIAWYTNRFTSTEHKNIENGRWATTQNGNSQNIVLIR